MHFLPSHNQFVEVLLSGHQDSLYFTTLRIFGPESICAAGVMSVGVPRGMIVRKKSKTNAPDAHRAQAPSHFNPIALGFQDQ
jgi:hypothetical protein